MNITIVTPYYAPAWGYGGPPKLLHEFALALKQRGHRINVITCDSLNGTRSKAYQDRFEGIPIYRLKTFSNYLAWSHKIFLPIGAKKYLARTLKTADFVFCSDLRHTLNISASTVCKKYQIPYSIAAYGEIAITKDWKSIFKNLYDLLYGKRIARLAMFLFAQTEHEMKAYKKYIGEHKNITLFPLAIDLAPFDKLPSINIFRKKYNLTLRDKLVLFVGRFNRYKGIDSLIKSINRIKTSVPNIKLVLVGRDDGYLSELKDMIQEYKLENHVIITPPLYNIDTIEAYSSADVFVITPPHSEETSLASLAALACGCPVIVNENCQIPWLDESNAGITIKKSENPDDALLQVLKYGKVGQKMGINARTLAHTRYSWVTRVKDFETLVSQQLKG